MKTRTGILIGIGLVSAVGAGNFVLNSVRTNADLRAIRSGNPASKDAAVRSLIARGVLFDALQGGAPPQTRLAAISALSKLAEGGANPAAFKELVLLLKDPDTESADSRTHPVRDAAREALVRVGAAYPELILDSAKDPDTNIRIHTVEALKKIGAPLQTALAQRMGDPALRGPCGEVLALIGPSSIPLITPWLSAEKLKETDILAKLALIEAFGRYKVGDAAKAIVRFETDNDPNVRRAVVTALANIGDIAAAPVLIRAATSRDTDASARAAAAGALGGIATPEACAALATLLRDDDTFVSVAAAAGLRRAGDRGQREIAQAASDPDATVRLRAAEAAGGMSSPTIARQLIADADPGVRTKATTAVADILYESLRSSKTVDAAALSGLAGRLADQDATVAAEASAGLARLGDTAIPALMTALGGSDTAAYHAVRALVVIGKPTVPALMRMLGGSGNVRRWSAVALGEIGAADAVGPLENLARASDPDTSYVAQMALSKLSGNN